MRFAPDGAFRFRILSGQTQIGEKMAGKYNVTFDEDTNVAHFDLDDEAISDIEIALGIKAEDPGFQAAFESLVNEAIKDYLVVSGNAVGGVRIDD